MTNFRMRTEQEMMMELALVAVKEHDGFIADGSQYSLPNGRGQTFVYNTAFLDVRFVEERNWMMKILISDFAQSVMEIMNIVQTICSHISMLKNLCKEKKKWQLLILLRYWVL